MEARGRQPLVINLMLISSLNIDTVKVLYLQLASGYKFAELEIMGKFEPRLDIKREDNKISCF